MKNLLTLFLFVIACGAIFAQDTLYYDTNRKPVQKGNHAFYKVIKRDPDNPELTGEFLFRSSQALVSSELFKNYTSKKKKRISYTRYYESGQPHVQSGMENGKRHGELITWWENGNLKRKDAYKKGKFLGGRCWEVNGEEVAHFPFEIHSEFPGGKKMLAAYLKNNINPEYSRGAYKGQKVLVRFVVQKDGAIDKIEVVNGGDAYLRIEAVRLIEHMPKWSPGRMDGEPVETTKILPLIF